MKELILNRECPSPRRGGAKKGKRWDERVKEKWKNVECTKSTSIRPQSAIRNFKS